MVILVTGGAGYIGSHTCVELMDAGYEVIVADNLINSKPEVLKRIGRIVGKEPKFYKVDLLDLSQLDRIFHENGIDSVIHFAGLKAVGESVSMPLEYYHNNISGTLNLLKVMRAHQVKKIVFSSSATVYGKPEKVPIKEDAPLSATNPYGRTKLMLEQMLKDLHASDDSWSIALLRYFNPIGAHESGLIGEDPNGIPNNLMPYISQVVVGKLPEVKVFGNDYPTPDGTGIRDYIHVVDLAKGHICALNKINEAPGCYVYNLGTGMGFSVLEMIRAMEKVCGKPIPYSIIDRRPGDIAECYADTTKAAKELNWKARKTIMNMCEDALRWQTRNPDGY